MHQYGYICLSFRLSMANISQIPFFFIIGRPRTGTTLLRSLFDAHPNVQIPWECQFVLNLYPKYGTLELWNSGTILFRSSAAMAVQFLEYRPR